MARVAAHDCWRHQFQQYGRKWGVSGGTGGVAEECDGRVEGTERVCDLLFCGERGEGAAE